MAQHTVTILKYLLNEWSWETVSFANSQAGELGMHNKIALLGSPQNL